MEDRSSPPATTSYYRPPLSVRHLASVSARNVVPPGGPPKRLAGVGVFFTLHECSRDRRKEGGVLYTSEVVRDTLNPDWAPLDEALVDAAAARANSRVAGDSPPSHVPLHEVMTLRVWFAPAPAPMSDSGTDSVSKKNETKTSFVLAFECDMSLGALVPLPGGARGQQLVSLSVSGGRARAGDRLSAPPNTPLIKTRVGVARNASVPGSIHEKTSHVETSSGDPLNPHDGWLVPRSRAWPALLTAAEAARSRDDADAASTEKEKERLAKNDFRLETLETSQTSPFAARATTRQIRVASEAILDATRRLRVASATTARLKARVAANVESLSSESLFKSSFGSSDATGAIDTPEPSAAVSLPTKHGRNTCVFDPSTRAATALVTIESLRKTRATLLSKIETARRECDLKSTSISARASSVRKSRDILRGAEARLRDADVIVKGPHGLGRLRSAQRQLVSRRWRLVGDLARVFPVTSFGEGVGIHPKDANKDVSHGDQIDDSKSGSGSGFGDESSPERNETKRSLRSTSENPLGSPLSSREFPLAIAGVPLDHTGSKERNASRSASQFPAGGRDPGGSGFEPSGARREIRNDATSISTLLNDPECAAAALGYVTQATLQLASVLDVPLRYPVAPGASRSYICDLQQVFQDSENGADVSAESVAKRSASVSSPEKKNVSGVSSGSPSLWRRVEFPLFAEPHAAEGTRFAYAVFLLNKDLEQILNAHGMLAVGPRHTLQNLKRLFAARKKIVGASAEREEGT